MSDQNLSNLLPHAVEVVSNRQCADNLYVLELKFTDESTSADYSIQPGEFNMLYAFGEGEIPVSVSRVDPENQIWEHAIQAVGDVSNAICDLEVGDMLGLRGPYGNSWPLKQAQGKDVLVISGGVGNAPLMLAIEEMKNNKNLYNSISVLHGVKSPKYLLFNERYIEWCKDINIYRSAMEDADGQVFIKGLVTDLIDVVNFNPENIIVFICGPEKMMSAVMQKLDKIGVQQENIFVSLERNMQCGVGLCGHCQCGDKFVCIDGPIFVSSEVSF